MTAEPATVIILEDDPTLRALLADGLRDADYAVVETATGNAAKDALAAAKGRVVLVADRSVDKDGPTGFQIASDALAVYPDLRVVYISGTHIAIRRRVMGERERALLKPFAIAQLLTMLRDLAA